KDQYLSLCTKNHLEHHQPKFLFTLSLSFSLFFLYLSLSLSLSHSLFLSLSLFLSFSISLTLSLSLQLHRWGQLGASFPFSLSARLCRGVCLAPPYPIPCHRVIASAL